MPDLILIISGQPDWPIRFASPEVDKICGLATGKLLGKPLTAILAGDMEGFSQKIEEVFQRNSSFEDIPCQLKESDPEHNRENKYTASLDSIITGDGVNQALAIIRITDTSSISVHAIKRELEKQHRQLLQAYDELRKTQNRLIQSEKLAATGQLAASIAHEINNPMYGIQGCLKTLLEYEGLSPADRDFLKLAVKETYRITNLIRQLQDFHKPGDFKMKAGDIHELLENVLVFNKSYLKSHNIRLIKRFHPLPIRLNMIEDQIKQVVTNLISNAVKAMPESGTLTIITGSTDRYAKISFADTGRGIPEKTLSHIFEPFFTTGKQVKGVGLGLSVAYGIMKKHEGRIEVSSRVNRGTTFTILLPL